MGHEVEKGENGDRDNGCPEYITHKDPGYRYIRHIYHFVTVQLAWHNENTPRFTGLTKVCPPAYLHAGTHDSHDDNGTTVNSEGSEAKSMKLQAFALLHDTQ